MLCSLDAGGGGGAETKVSGALAGIILSTALTRKVLQPVRLSAALKILETNNSGFYLCILNVRVLTGSFIH